MFLIRSKASSCALFLAAAIFAAPASAQAQTPSVPVQLAYSAPAYCPNIDAFAHQLMARTTRVRLVLADGLARALRVLIRDARGLFVGTLSISGADGKTIQRTVDGKNCDQVVAALGLIGALALDPETVGASLEQDAGDSTRGSAVDAQGGPPPSSDTTRNNDPTPPTKSQGDRRNDASSSGEKRGDRNRQARDATTSPWQLAFGADAEAIAGVSPKIMGTTAAFLELSKRKPQSFLIPSVRVRFERPGTDGTVTSQGSAHFTWTEGSIDLSMLSWWPRRGWRLQPALRVEVGVVDGSGMATVQSRSETRPWMTVGGVMISRWEIVGPLFIEVETALVVPVVRDRFYLDPASTTVFQASVLGLTGAGGLGVSIW